MKVGTLLIGLFLLFFKKNSFCQVNDQTTLINVSRLYYQSLNFFSIEIDIKNKSSIAEDTTFGRSRCFIDNINRNKLFILSNSRKVFITGPKEDEYFISSDNKQFEKVKNSQKKFTMYHDLYKYYPFLDPSFFFDELKKKKMSFRETDSSYLLLFFLDVYEFRKSNYSIQKIINCENDEINGGVFYRETKFKDCYENDPEAALQMNNILEIIGSKENAKTPVDKAHSKPESFDISLFKSKSIKIINYDNKAFDNKVIFLDFFYEACYPCIRSFPNVNNLYESRNSNLVVIGVDADPNDTLNIQQFLKRYNINHPVIIGAVAVEIEKQLKISGWPSFVIIAPDGKILEYQVGDSENFFKKAERKYAGRIVN